MFKIAKLENVKNEKINIEIINHSHCSFKDGKKEKEDNIKALSFTISGDNYSLSFTLNCSINKLLELPQYETINFNDFLLGGETWLNINGLNGVEPEINIKITRYIKNKYIMNTFFYTEYSYDDNVYSGIIEFTFNLDDYPTN